VVVHTGFSDGGAGSVDLANAVVTACEKPNTFKQLTPEGTPIVTSVPADRSALKPGVYIYTVARQEADGRIVAQRIQASKDGVRPPQ